MAKLDLQSTVSAQVAALFNKALTSKSATTLIGTRLTIDTTSTLEVDIKGNQTAALLGWITPGEEAKEVWTSWLTRRGTSSETGEVFSNGFIINDEEKLLSPQEVVEIIINHDLLLEKVNYHYVVEPTFSSTGQRTGEKDMKRPFFTWRVLPRREVPPMTEWSQEVLSRISSDQAPSPAEDQPTQNDTSDDVPF